MYSGASLKKSKHYSGINFISGVNSSKFFIVNEAQSIRNHFGDMNRVNWIIFRWREKEVSNWKSYFDSFLLVLFVFKALGVGQVKDVKQRWYQIITRNVFAIISPTSPYSWISPTMLMTGRWVFFFFDKIKLYGSKKVHRSIKVSHLFLFININISFDTDKINMTFTVFQSG